MLFASCVPQCIYNENFDRFLHLNELCSCRKDIPHRQDQVWHQRARLLDYAEVQFDPAQAVGKVGTQGVDKAVCQSPLSYCHSAKSRISE